MEIDAFRAHSPVVLITWPDFEASAPECLARLRSAGCRPRLAPKVGRRSSAELASMLSDVDAVIASTDPFDHAVLTSAPSLRVIARVGVGVDSIDVGTAAAQGIAVSVSGDLNASTTADHAVALMLAALRRIPEHDRAVRSGAWPRTGSDAPWELAGAAVGLVGFGRIGRLVARRLRGFDVTLRACDPDAASDAEVGMVDLPSLLRESDVVSLHLPLNEGTRGLIGASELETMRADAVLVNTARGELVDQDALAEALQAGRLRAAALDVFDEEPPVASRILDFDNVIVTPHTGGISTRSVAQMLRQATTDVLDVLAGRAPAGLINGPLAVSR